MLDLFPGSHEGLESTESTQLFSTLSVDKRTALADPSHRQEGQSE